MLTSLHLAVKNDGSLLFKKLNELNTIHRIIMTGVRSLYLSHFAYFLISEVPDSSEQQHA